MDLGLIVRCLCAGCFGFALGLLVLNVGSSNPAVQESATNMAALSMMKRSVMPAPMSRLRAPQMMKGCPISLRTSPVARAEVKLGSDGGGLVFVPDKLTIKAGESVTFKNNVGFPHNVVFDEDAIPEGVDAAAISKEDYLNAAGETVDVKFTKAGEYNYYCEPHRGAGMKGTITVQ